MSEKEREEFNPGGVPGSQIDKVGTQKETSFLKSRLAMTVCGEGLQ